MKALYAIISATLVSLVVSAPTTEAQKACGVSVEGNPNCIKMKTCVDKMSKKDALLMKPNVFSCLHGKYQLDAWSCYMCDFDPEPKISKQVVPTGSDTLPDHCKVMFLEDKHKMFLMDDQMRTVLYFASKATWDTKHMNKVAEQEKKTELVVKQQPTTWSKAVLGTLLVCSVMAAPAAISIVGVGVAAAWAVSSTQTGAAYLNAMSG